MAQHDMNISNQAAAAARSDLNDALAALVSLSSGATAPGTTYPNMLWYDSNTNILKMRTEADDGWISLFYLDQGSGAFRMLENVQIVDSSGTQKGLLGPQDVATWKAGVGTLEGLINPAKLKATIEELAPSFSNDDIQDGTLGSEKFQSGTDERNWVLGRTSVAAVGAVGTYATLLASPVTSPGGLLSGAQISYSDSGEYDGGAPSGSWRCMGQTGANNRSTTFLRIS